MPWDVEYTEEFREWIDSLDEGAQEAILADVVRLQEDGPLLGRPKVDTLSGTRHANMKELRTHHAGRPYRTFFAFDPRRTAILLCGGDKGGDKRFYQRMIRLAESLYDDYLQHLKDRGVI